MHVSWNAFFRTAAVLVLWSVTTLAGAQGLESTKGVALVVGNGAYGHVKPLANPANDADDMARVLKDLGWDVVLTKDSTLASFRASVREFGKKLAGSKAGFFYYAGHGLQVDGVNYLVPVDADIQSKAEIPDVTVPADLVLRTMDESQVPLKIVVLDACRDNPFEKARSVGGTRGLSVVQTQATGTIMVFATAPNDVSQDGTGRNGVFTGAFLKNLQVPGVEFQEIFDLTAQEVTSATGGKQNPWMNKSYYSKLYFISPADAQAQADLQLTRLKAEEDRLDKEMGDRAKALAGTLDAAEKEKLEIDQKKAQAAAEEQRQEQSVLEATRTAAVERAAEEEKNRDLAARRNQETEAQLAALKQQVEARRAADQASGTSPDDPGLLVRRLVTLDRGLAEIHNRFAEGLAKGTAAAMAAWQARKTSIDQYTLDPWENQKDLDRRKAQALGLATRDRDNEVAQLKFKFSRSEAAEGAELAKERDSLSDGLLSREWPLPGSSLTLTRGDFNRDDKTWPLTVTGSKPGFTQTLGYPLDAKTPGDLKAAYTAFDTAWKAGAYGPQGFFRVSKVSYGEYWQASLTRLAVVDITADGGPVVTLNLSQPLGWVGPAPEPAQITLTVPRAAVLVSAGVMLADLKPQLFNPNALTFVWTSDAYGTHQVQARYSDGDKETLTVDLEPGRKVTLGFTAKVKPLAYMAQVPGGTYLMGSSPGEKGRKRDELSHPVTVAPFTIGTTDVTVAQWQRVMGNNPVPGRAGDLPVTSISWFDAVNYCNRLSLSEGRTPAYTVNGATVTWDRTADGYRLPTEAEWEWAARGGTQANGNLYPGSSWADEVLWSYENSGRSIHPAGQKKPNGLGLYDMGGNVSQWCWDWYGNYGIAAQTNPSGPAQGPARVIRGGNWASSVAAARVADRAFTQPGTRAETVGFRVVGPSDD